MYIYKIIFNNSQIHKYLFLIAEFKVYLSQNTEGGMFGHRRHKMLGCSDTGSKILTRRALHRALTILSFSLHSIWPPGEKAERGKKYTLKSEIIFLFHKTGIVKYLKKLLLYIHNRWKFGVGMIFLYFWKKEVSYSNQGCIYLIKNAVRPLILWNIIAYFNL